ncbi:hypothetical protein HG530_001960 [Fusarium avenaceum]|nr:hypothetical protein HG530_001960 [Fusarium avenaceum]
MPDLLELDKGKTAAGLGVLGIAHAAHSNGVERGKVGFDGFGGGGERQVSDKDNMTVCFALRGRTSCIGIRFGTGHRFVVGGLVLLLLVLLALLGFLLGLGFGAGVFLLWCLFALGLLLLLLLLLFLLRSLLGIYRRLRRLVLSTSHCSILGRLFLVVLFGKVLEILALILALLARLLLELLVSLLLLSLLQIGAIILVALALLSGCLGVDGDAIAVCCGKGKRRGLQDAESAVVKKSVVLCHVAK